MKKFFAVILAVILAAPAFAEYQFSGWKCNDAAKFQASIAAASTIQQKCRETVLLRMLQSPVNSFAEFATLVDSTVDELKGNTDAEKVSALKLLLKKQIPYNQNIWIADAWKFCQANPNFYDIYYVFNRSKAIGMTDAQAYTWLINYLLRNQPDAKQAGQIIDKIIDLAPGLTGIDVKADLQKLNRKYSKNLLQDKTKWEPIIAKIRTTLETY